MATIGESKSARKHVGTAPGVLASDVNEGEHEFFIAIEKLQNVGINAADITKLRLAGYCTVLSVIQTTKKDLALVKGLSEAKVEKIIEAATKLELCNSFISGGELVIRRAKVVKITTGSSQLDQLIGGGIETMSITEIFGENRCGKTQICHTLCVTAQLPKEMNGGCGKVCYVDTEATFRPEKICAIAERFGLDGAGVLDNIMYARAYTTEHMHQLLTVAAAKMSEEKFAIIIVDSIIALFRVDFCGRGELADRQQKLNKMLSSLIKISEQYNVAVVVTNQVMSDPAGGLTFVANPTKPVGGHVLGHASTTRLSLRKGKGEQRICKVYDAPNLPESECIFQLTTQGISDVME
ncbi:meiotic recombination protein DMC1 homolog [Cyclospora cayetanensis]|uniref:Meiotic recombination protein DMC1 homolog n=1 Tax=Cyclospora cayetanensis TaxID=88456 RepID=A0A6P6RVK3_9EIME|nr:meiotic recombination protein DMC1 homolog [Cyclospora cayetanensis]